MLNINAIILKIEQYTSQKLTNAKLIAIGGGSINDAYRLQSSNQSYFIKLNKAHLAFMFEAEAQGLKEMKALGYIRVPNVICHGQTNEHSYLVLEYIELSSLRDRSSTLLGSQLAKLHQHPQYFYGWHIDNTIGSTLQYNTHNHDWQSFWQQHRLGQQLKLAEKNGFTGQIQKNGQKLLESLHVFFGNYSPKASILHGDLWSGNTASDSEGNPVIFDPACYYGDREADIAMTELFGGFDNNFYSAYQAQYPLDPGYKVRKTLYNLYHILNHLNLFGSGYLSQSENMINQLLAET